MTRVMRFTVMMTCSPPNSPVMKEVRIYPPRNVFPKVRYDVKSIILSKVPRLVHNVGLAGAGIFDLI